MESPTVYYQFYVWERHRQEWHLHPDKFVSLIEASQEGHKTVNSYNAQSNLPKESRISYDHDLVIIKSNNKIRKGIKL